MKTSTIVGIALLLLGGGLGYYGIRQYLQTTGGTQKRPNIMLVGYGPNYTPCSGCPKPPVLEI